MASMDQLAASRRRAPGATACVVDGQAKPAGQILHAVWAPVEKVPTVHAMGGWSVKSVDGQL